MKIETLNHIYKIDGKEYTRVTTALSIISKPELIPWFNKVGGERAEQIKKKRGELGTVVHNLIKKNLEGKKVDLSKYNAEIEEDLNLFPFFAKAVELNPLYLEIYLWSNKHLYGGKTDCIGKYKSNKEYLVRGHKAKFKRKSKVLLDWKTSRQIYKSQWLQVAAYVFAHEEMTGEKLKGGVIVLLRYGKIKVKEKTYEELKEDYEAFLHALYLYRWKHGKIHNKRKG